MSKRVEPPPGTERGTNHYLRTVWGYEVICRWWETGWEQFERRHARPPDKTDAEYVGRVPSYAEFQRLTTLASAAKDWREAVEDWGGFPCEFPVELRNAHDRLWNAIKDIERPENT